MQLHILVLSASLYLPSPTGNSRGVRFHIHHCSLPAGRPWVQKNKLKIGWWDCQPWRDLQGWISSTIWVQGATQGQERMHGPPEHQQLEFIKGQYLIMISVAQLVEHHPAKWKVAGSISSQGTCLGCRFGGQVWKATDQCFSSSLSPFLPLSLKINEIFF